MIYPTNKIYAKLTINMGMGVFAYKDISKGDVIDVNYCIKIDDESYIKSNNKPLIFYDYALMYPKTKKTIDDKSYRVISLGFGALFNNSKKPNADWRNGKESYTLEWYAIEDIKENQQIFINYGDGYCQYIEKIKNIKFI